jgi:hypothetical protein
MTAYRFVWDEIKKNYRRVPITPEPAETTLESMLKLATKLQNDQAKLQSDVEEIKNRMIALEQQLRALRLSIFSEVTPDDDKLR